MSTVRRTARKPRWKRVLVKISGETLAGKGHHGFDAESLSFIAREIAAAARCGVQIAIVIGGGNLIRGSEIEGVGIDRSSADYMGMLATMANGIALQTVLEREGLDTRVLSALPLSQVAEPFIRRRAIHHLEKGRIVICVGGTGNPHFTTDTAAALRARELRADVLVKGTTVDGVFTADPKKSKNAKRLSTVRYKEIITKDLRVMDLTAVTLAQETAMPIVVFDVFRQGNLKRLLCGKRIGTEIS
ncbi:UMP kinase [Candidatus Uhrbacteria bacterium]|nr:UMP kinase [Candidatus Uhrbacteria bacterium]